MFAAQISGGTARASSDRSTKPLMLSEGPIYGANRLSENRIAILKAVFYNAKSHRPSER